MRHPLPTLQHIGLELTAADLPRALRFWSLLGFCELEVPPSLRGRAAWLGGPGGQVHLLLVEAAPTPTGGHVALVVGERLHPVASTLRQEGFDVEEREARWGTPRMLATAPGGHPVELMAQAPPSVPTGRPRQ